MKKLIFLLITILIYSCNKSQITESKNVDNNRITNDKLTQPQNNMKIKPITFELIKDMPVDEVVKEYPPVREETFILGKEGGFITEFRVGLLKIFDKEEIKSRDIKIREITWNVNDKQNLTVWYNEKNGIWIPIDHFLWDKDSEF